MPGHSAPTHGAHAQQQVLRRLPVHTPSLGTPRPPFGALNPARVKSRSSANVALTRCVQDQIMVAKPVPRTTNTYVESAPLATSAGAAMMAKSNVPW
jgi:hypothetical protein